MKKTALLAILLCGLVAAFIVGTTMPTTPVNADDAQLQENAESFGGPLEVQDSPQTLGQQEPVEEPNVIVQELRSRYLDLFQKRLKTLTPKQMNDEIGQLQKQVDEHEANEKLMQARQHLQRIVFEHPGTKAATWAQKMLDAKLLDGMVPDYVDPDQPPASNFESH